MKVLENVEKWNEERMAGNGDSTTDGWKKKIPRRFQALLSETPPALLSSPNSSSLFSAGVERSIFIVVVVIPKRVKRPLRSVLPPW